MLFVNLITFTYKYKYKHTRSTTKTSAPNNWQTSDTASISNSPWKAAYTRATVSPQTPSLSCVRKQKLMSRSGRNSRRLPKATWRSMTSTQRNNSRVATHGHGVHGGRPTECWTIVRRYIQLLVPCYWAFRQSYSHTTTRAERRPTWWVHGTKRRFHETHNTEVRRQQTRWSSEIFWCWWQGADPQS